MCAWGGGRPPPAERGARQRGRGHRPPRPAPRPPARGAGAPPVPPAGRPPPRAPGHLSAQRPAAAPHRREEARGLGFGCRGRGRGAGLAASARLRLALLLRGRGRRGGAGARFQGLRAPRAHSGVRRRLLVLRGLLVLQLLVLRGRRRYSQCLGRRLHVLLLRRRRLDVSSTKGLAHEIGSDDFSDSILLWSRVFKRRHFAQQLCKYFGER